MEAIARRRKDNSGDDIHNRHSNPLNLWGYIYRANDGTILRGA